MNVKPLIDMQKQAFNSRLMNVWGNFDKLNKAIEDIVQTHGVNWYNVSEGKMHPNEAQENTDSLLLKAQETNTKHTVEALEELLKIKTDYKNTIMPPSSNKYDVVEISILEKEMSVMTDDELEQYYKENWLDDMLTRLIVVQKKKRALAKHGITAGVTILTRETYSDSFTKEIDEFISFVNAIAMGANTRFIYVYNPITKTVFTQSWEAIFRYIRVKSHNGTKTAFSLADLMNPQFGVLARDEEEAFIKSSEPIIKTINSKF